METGSDLERAVDAYNKAWAEAKKFGDEAAAALIMADLQSSQSTKKLFIDRAKRSLVASENYRKAADLCLKVIGELEQR